LLNLAATATYPADFLYIAVAHGDDFVKPSPSKIDFSALTHPDPDPHGGAGHLNEKSETSGSRSWLSLDLNSLETSATP